AGGGWWGRGRAGPTSGGGVGGMGVARSCMTAVTRPLWWGGMAVATRWELPWCRSVQGRTMSASVCARRWASTWAPTDPEAPARRMRMAGPGEAAAARSFRGGGFPGSEEVLLCCAEGADPLLVVEAERVQRSREGGRDEFPFEVEAPFESDHHAGVDGLLGGGRGEFPFESGLGEPLVEGLGWLEGVAALVDVVAHLLGDDAVDPGGAAGGGADEVE